MDRLMKYNEVKGVRFNLNAEHLEDELILTDPYEYIRIERLKNIANYDIAVYINDAKEEEYIVFEDSITFEEIEVRKVRIKLLNVMPGKSEIQVMLMR